MKIWDYPQPKAGRPIDPRWKLERQLTYGLEPNEKLARRDLIAYWNNLKIDHDRRAFLELLLWPKKS